MINILKNKYISRKFHIKFRIIDENIYCYFLENKPLTNLVHLYSRRNLLSLCISVEDKSWVPWFIPLCWYISCIWDVPGMDCTAIWTDSCDTMESDTGMLLSRIELSIERLWENHGMCIANLCPTFPISSQDFISAVSLSERLEHFLSSEFVTRSNKSVLDISSHEVEVLVFALYF